MQSTILNEFYNRKTQLGNINLDHNMKRITQVNDLKYMQAFIIASDSSIGPNIGHLYLLLLLLNPNDTIQRVQKSARKLLRTKESASSSWLAFADVWLLKGPMQKAVVLTFASL